MPLSTLQQQAIDAWTQGHNVKVTACPGAGKSRVLLEACKQADGLCIILAYNRDLYLETKLLIEELKMDDWTICFTFHGLATYCVQECPDDITLAEVLDQLNNGSLAPKRVLDRIDKILIDECQDFRWNFLHLLRHLVPATSTTQYMVVGDLKQMLYDYSDDDPADPAFLETPWSFFVSRIDW